MTLRKAYFQLCVLIGGCTFAFTLWQALRHSSDPIQVSMRAVGAGAAIIIVALIIYKFIENLDDSRF